MATETALRSLKHSTTVCGTNLFGGPQTPMVINFDQPLSRTELARSLGVSRVTLWRLEKAGRLPAAQRINGRRSEVPPETQMLAADLIAGSRA